MHIDGAEIQKGAETEHCPDHPDNEGEAGFGLAGGGFGTYMVCTECGRIFGKTQDHSDEE